MGSHAARGLPVTRTQWRMRSQPVPAVSSRPGALTRAPRCVGARRRAGVHLHHRHAGGAGGHTAQARARRRRGRRRRHAAARQGPPLGPGGLSGPAHPARRGPSGGAARPSRRAGWRCLLKFGRRSDLAGLSGADVWQGHIGHQGLERLPAGSFAGARACWPLGSRCCVAARWGSRGSSHAWSGVTTCQRLCSCPHLFGG